MNALANDQMKRLRRILEKYPQITFGRYINIQETPDTSTSRRIFKNMYGDSEPIIPNELKSREEMTTPPHLLATNYAMLEYLLLRPSATNLFDGETGKHWHFIVLDEAHVYDGANARKLPCCFGVCRIGLLGTNTAESRVSPRLLPSGLESKITTKWQSLQVTCSTKALFGMMSIRTNRMLLGQSFTDRCARRDVGQAESRYLPSAEQEISSNGDPSESWKN